VKKVTLAVMVIAGLSGISSAIADTSDIKTSNNQVGFQLISTNVDYTETGNGILGSQTGTLDTERGPVPGSAVSISAMKDLWLGNDYVEAEYDYSSGNTEYVGGLLGPHPTPYGSVVSTSGATLTNYSARYGVGFMDDGQTMLTPYLEFGHHEWDRSVNAGERYTNDYFGIGVLGQYSPASRLVLSANVMLGKTFTANITVNPTSGAGGGGFSGALGNSVLYRIGAGTDYLFAQNLHGTIGVDYTSFKYGISALYPVGGNYVAWEPDSKTNYTTVRIGLGYGF
jgi:hypothetical protein